jgi:hypothetical protein
MPVFESIGIVVKLSHWKRLQDIWGIFQVKNSYWFDMSIMPMVLFSGVKTEIKIKSLDNLPAELWKKIPKESIPSGAALKGMLQGLVGMALSSVPVAQDLKDSFETSVAPTVEITARYKNIGAYVMANAPNLSTLISS